MDYLPTITGLIKIFYNDNKDNLEKMKFNRVSDDEFEEKINEMKISKKDLENVKEDEVLDIMKIYVANSNKGVTLKQNLARMWKFYTSKINYFDKMSFFIILIIIFKIIKSPSSLFDNFIKYGLFSGFTYILHDQSCKMKIQTKTQRIYGRDAFDHIKDLIGLGKDFSYIKVGFENGASPLLNFLDHYNVNYYNLSEPTKKSGVRLAKNSTLEFCKKFIESYNAESDTELENIISNFVEKIDISQNIDTDLDFQNLQKTMTLTFLKCMIIKFYNENGKKPKTKKEIDSIVIQSFNNIKEPFSSNFDYQNISYSRMDFENIYSEMYDFITQDYKVKNMVLPVILTIVDKNKKFTKIIIHQRQQVLSAKILNDNYSFPLIWEIKIDYDTEENMVESLKTFLGVF